MKSGEASVSESHASVFKLPRLLITGADGQLGYETAAMAQDEGFDVIALGRDALDLLDPDAVQRQLAAHRPQYVINAAATFEGGLQVNSIGAGRLAQACAQAGVALIHISCAEVFAGDDEAYYTEQAEPAPCSEYGHSKLNGEAAVREALSRHIILRTGWLFSARGRSSVLNLLERARTQKELVVSDTVQIAPTSALDLARVILAIIKQLDCGCDNWGTYHYTGAGPLSWFGFCEAVIAAARQYEDLLLDELVADEAAASAERKRPTNGRLGCDRIRATFGIHQRSWRLGLMRVMRRLYM